VKASRVRISESGIKTVEGVRRVVHVAPSRRLCRRQFEDERVNATGYVGHCHPCFTVFLVLGPRDILIF
jgi:hypothetical protein